MLRKPLLTTHEVAVLLKMKEATIRRWIRNGELPALHIGREWRIAVIQLEEFLKVRSTGMPPEPKRQPDVDQPVSGFAIEPHQRAKPKQRRRERNSRDAR